MSKILKNALVKYDPQNADTLSKMQRRMQKKSNSSINLYVKNSHRFLPTNVGCDPVKVPLDYLAKDYDLKKAIYGQLTLNNKDTLQQVA